MLSVFYRLRRNQIHVLSKKLLHEFLFQPARQIRNRNSHWGYSTANIDSIAAAILRDHPSHHDQSTSAIALSAYVRRVADKTPQTWTCSDFQNSGQGVLKLPVSSMLFKDPILDTINHRSATMLSDSLPRFPCPLSLRTSHNRRLSCSNTQTCCSGSSS